MKKILQLSGFGILAISLSACQAIPKAHTEAVIPQPNIATTTPYEVYDQATVSDEQLKSIASERWQDFYTDENLKKLITLALQNNKDINTAILNIQKARATYQITDNSNIPTVGVSGKVSYGASEARDKNPSESYEVGLGISSYEFDFWGKIANQKESALQTYLATGTAQDIAQISLISAIAQSYVAYGYNFDKLRLAEQTLKTRLESLHINQKRFQAGLDSKLTTVQAQGLVDSARVSIANAKTALLKNHNALRQLVGTDFDPKLLPREAVVSVTNHQIFSTGLPSDLLLYRPDIRQAEHLLKAKGANIKVARANFFPNISLSASAGTASADLSDLFKTGTFSWGLTPTISLPIFNKNLSVQHEVAEIDEKLALTAYEKSIQTAFKEVNDVLATRATIYEQIGAYHNMRSANQESYRIANARFKAGLDNFLGVLEALRNQYNTEQSLLTTRQALINSQIELYQVLGGGANRDVALDIVEEVETAEPVEKTEEKQTVEETTPVETTQNVETVEATENVAEEKTTPVLETPAEETLVIIETTTKREKTAE